MTRAVAFPHPIKKDLRTERKAKVELFSWTPLPPFSPSSSGPISYSRLACSTDQCPPGMGEILSPMSYVFNLDTFRWTVALSRWQFGNFNKPQEFPILGSGCGLAGNSRGPHVKLVQLKILKTKHQRAQRPTLPSVSGWVQRTRLVQFEYFLPHRGSKGEWRRKRPFGCVMHIDSTDSQVQRQQQQLLRYLLLLL